MKSYSCLLTAFVLVACSGGRTVVMTDPAVSTSTQPSEVNNTKMDNIEIDARKGKGIDVPTIPVEKEPTQPPSEPQPNTPPPPETPTTNISELDAKLPTDMVFIPGDGANVPVDAIWAGNTSGLSNVRSYVCRVQQGSNYLLGSLKSNGRCYVTDGTVARGETAFKLLVYTGSSVGDVMTTVTGNGTVPAKGLAMGLKEGRVQYLCFVAAQNDYFLGSVDSQSNGCVFADFGSGKANAPVPGKSSSGYYSAVSK